MSKYPRQPTTRPRLAGASFEIAAHLESCARTDAGLHREENEDALFVDDERGLYLVCDGMGGHASGKVAADLAVRIVAGLVLSKANEHGREPLVVALEGANSAVLKRAGTDPDFYRMGTTAVGLRFADNDVHICHCGDSRCYRLRGGQLAQLTRDHSLSNLYVDKPELAEQLGPAHSNVIVRAIGLQESVEVDHQALEANPGDLFLLCCDGLTDLVADAAIADTLTSDVPLATMADSLVRQANEAGGTDNITVVLVKVSAKEVDGESVVSDVFGGDDHTMPGY